jgi:hypothetical protein
VVFYPAEQDRINTIIQSSASSGISLEQIISIQIQEWRNSQKLKWMMIGECYYHGPMEIKNKKTEIHGRANQKLEYMFVRKLVDQKIGYLLSKPFSIKTDNAKYADLLNRLFDGIFLRILKNVGKDAVTKGIGWLFVYINGDGELAFKKIPAHEVIPIWSDMEHEEMDAVIRVYEVEVFESENRIPFAPTWPTWAQSARLPNGGRSWNKKTETKVEYYDTSGVKYFTYEGSGHGIGTGRLVPDVSRGVWASYFITTDENPAPYNWKRVPFIPFKYNEEEQPLVQLIKSLVDDYNLQNSINADIMADIPLFVYVLKNYDGQELGPFLENLRAARAIKVLSDGGVDKLTAEPVTDALQAHLNLSRKAIYEFGRGVDTQNDDAGNASGVALKFRYADLDMDANILDTEFQASFKRLLWFADEYFTMTRQGDYSADEVGIVLNRDIIISESDVIADCKASEGIISHKTILANHPWVDSVEKEMEQQEQEETEAEAKMMAAQYMGMEGDEVD